MGKKRRLIKTYKEPQNVESNPYGMHMQVTSLAFQAFRATENTVLIPCRYTGLRPKYCPRQSLLPDRVTYIYRSRCTGYESRSPRAQRLTFNSDGLFSGGNNQDMISHDDSCLLSGRGARTQLQAVPNTVISAREWRIQRFSSLNVCLQIFEVLVCFIHFRKITSLRVHCTSVLKVHVVT